MVKEILDRANVGRSTFYTHFRDKNELLLSGIQDMVRGTGTSLTGGAPVWFDTAAVRAWCQKGVKQIPYRKQGEAESCTREIEVVTDAILEPPMHPGQEVERFADMSKDNHQKTSCAEELEA